MQHNSNHDNKSSTDAGPSIQEQLDGSFEVKFSPGDFAVGDSNEPFQLITAQQISDVCLDSVHG